MAASSGSKVSRFCKRIGEVILTRFPFACALLLTMVCHERESNDRPVGYSHLVVYLNIALLVLEGSMMSFATQRSLFALMCAVQTAVMALITHTSPSLQFKSWFTIRMLSRDLGVIGSYLVMASRTHEQLTRRYRLAKLYAPGRGLLAAFFVVLAYQLHREDIDQNSFLHHIPGGHVVMTMTCVACMGCSIMLMSDVGTRVAVRVLLAVLVLVMVVDIDVNYWMRLRVEYWNQLWLVAKDVCIAATLLLLAT